MNAAPALAGRWRSVTTTRGGIGAVYDFRATGVAAYSSAAIVDMDYQASPGQISMGGQAVGMGWHPDGRLQFNYGGNNVEDYTRQGKVVDPATPLLGEWKGTRLMAGRPVPVLLQFHPANRALLVMYLKTQTGRYQSSGDAWVITLPSLPARSVTPAAEGQITITANGGDPHQFARF
jgi:hypothetical protein